MISTDEDPGGPCSVRSLADAPEKMRSSSSSSSSSSATTSN